MGDRYQLQIKCADCGVLNEHWHAETSCSMSFGCINCKKINWVYMDFVAKIVSPEELKKLYKLNGCE